MSQQRTAGFRLGIYVFKDAEIVDFAAPYGVFSVARRFDPELDAFLIADSLRPVQTQAGFTVLPNYSFNDRPAMNAFLIPGGFGTRQEMHNQRLHEFIRSLPPSCLLTSVCTGSWVYGKVGLLDGLPATNRKEPDRVEASTFGTVPIDRLAEIAPACKISRARVVDAGRMITAGGIASGMEMGFHLLRRAGYDESFISEVARVMEYQQAYNLYRSDIEIAGGRGKWNKGCQMANETKLDAESVRARGPKNNKEGLEMGSGCCGSEDKATYECAANPRGCPPKQVPANTPAPSCCGKPMKKKAAASSCR